jgi:hypothetical protein
MGDDAQPFGCGLGHTLHTNGLIAERNASSQGFLGRLQDIFSPTRARASHERERSRTPASALARTSSDAERDNARPADALGGNLPDAERGPAAAVPVEAGGAAHAERGHPPAVRPETGGAKAAGRAERGGATVAGRGPAAVIRPDAGGAAAAGRGPTAAGRPDAGGVAAAVPPRVGGENGAGPPQQDAARCGPKRPSASSTDRESDTVIDEQALRER